MNRNFTFGSVSLGVVIMFGFMLLVPTVSAATTCTFARDLQMGIIGEDVRCLQKYLNANGFMVATTGVGSPGKETTEFKTLTEAALIKWQQANKLSSASGYFGPRSQLVYKTLVSGSLVKTVSSSALASGVDVSPEALLARVTELKSQLAGSLVAAQNDTFASSTISTTDKLVVRFKKITKSLRDAEKTVAKNEDAAHYDEAVDGLTSARDDFYLAVLAYLGGDTVKTNKAFDYVEESIDDVLEVISDR